jgi:hypothetical protein
MRSGIWVMLCLVDLMVLGATCVAAPSPLQSATPTPAPPVASTEYVVKFFSDNAVGIVVGVLATFAAGLILKGFGFAISVVRKVGFRQFGAALKESMLHASAYPRIKAEPVLSIAYLSIHLALLLASSAAFIVLVMFLLWGDIALWLRIIVSVLAVVAFARAAKRIFVIWIFYGLTAGSVIEETKKTSWLYKDKNKTSEKKEPFIQFGSPKPSGETIEATPVDPAPPTTPSTS